MLNLRYIVKMLKKLKCSIVAIPSNYRPVSLASHVIKIFERVKRKKLVTFLESNNLLCSHQHEFRSGHSYLTQLLHHFDDVLENYLVGADTDSIYLDYAKAFDKVDHALLIKKAPKIWDTSPSRKLDKIISLWQNTVSCHVWSLVSGCPDNKWCTSGNSSGTNPVPYIH